MAETKLYECDWCEGTMTCTTAEIVGRYQWKRIGTKLDGKSYTLWLCSDCKSHALKSA